MSEDVRRLIAAADSDDPGAAEQLLPIVYEQLKAIAARAMAAENPGQTLTPTALVHEAYLRLAAAEPPAGWDGRRHFVGAAARAMRRILIEAGRKKADRRRLAGRPVDLDSEAVPLPEVGEELLALDVALDAFAEHDPVGARLVELRFFAGLTQQEAAAALVLSPRTADRVWAVAKAWLYQEMHGA